MSDSTALALAAGARTLAGAAGALLKRDAASAFYAAKVALQNNNGNAMFLVVGDSTTTRSGGSSTADGGFIIQFIRLLAPLFPAYTFVYRSSYSSSTGLFGLTETIQTGTGSNFCYFYSVAVGGTIPAHSLGNANFWSAYTGVGNPITDATQSFDVIIYNYGFNSTQQGQLLATLESIHGWNPRSSIVVIEQWPQVGNNNSAVACRNNRALARLKNATLVPTENLLLAAGKPTSWYNTANVGEVHLSQLGYSFIAAMLMEMWNSAQEMRWPVPPALDIPRPNLLSNGTFDTYSAGTAAGWSATNCTLSEDTTNYLTGSRSLVLTITSNADAYIEQTISNPGVLRRLSRRAITLSGDICYPTSQPSTSGRLVIRRSGADVAISDRPYSSASSLYDQADGSTWVKKATTLQLPVLDGTVPIVIRFYALLGTDASRNGTGVVVKLDNIKLDIGERIFDHL